MNFMNLFVQHAFGDCACQRQRTFLALSFCDHDGSYWLGNIAKSLFLAHGHFFCWRVGLFGKVLFTIFALVVKTIKALLEMPWSLFFAGETSDVAYDSPIWE